MVYLVLVSALAGVLAPLSFTKAPPVFPADPGSLSREDAAVVTTALLNAISDRFHPQRYWEPERVPSQQSAQPGGRTALAVLALLDAGIPAQRPDIASAINALERHSMEGTYAIAARLMAFARLPKGRLERARRDVGMLLESFDPKAYGWDYGPSPRSTFVDQSLTQFVTLALAEASERGIEVPKEVFERVRERFLHLQGPDGGWGYRIDDPSRGSMTAAGLATIALCNRHAPGKGSLLKRSEEAKSQAILWLEKEFTAKNNPGHSRWTDYWLLSAERAARATGLLTFSGEEWLQSGAASIASRLLARSETGWRIRGGRPAGIEKLCFAAMFMRRAQEPIAVSMLVERETAVDSADLSVLARQISEMLERRVGWARVDIDNSEETWLRSPVLLIRLDEKTAHEAIQPASKLAPRVRTYIQLGGTVVLCAPRAGTRLRKKINAFGEWVLPGASWKKAENTELPRTSETLGTRTRTWIYLLPGIDPMASHSRRAELAANTITKLWRDCTGGIPWPRLPGSAEVGQPSSLWAQLKIHTLEHAGEWRPEPGVDTILSSRLTRIGISSAFEVISADEHEGLLDSDALVWVRGHSSEEAMALPIELLEAHSAAGGMVILESVAGGAFAPTLAKRLASHNGGRLLPFTQSGPSGSWPANLTAIFKNEKPIAIVFLNDCSSTLLERGERGGASDEAVCSLLEWIAKTRSTEDLPDDR